MKNVCRVAVLLGAWIAVFAGLAVAQAPRPSLSFPNTDVNGSILFTSPDYGAHFDSYLLHGFEGTFSKSLTERLWITAAGSYVFGTSYDVKQFSGTVGPKYFILKGKWRPYVTAQAGYARQSSNGFYANDHHPPLPKGANDVESGFSYRVGGGVEYQFLSRLYWRAQWDVQPQPWARNTPLYINIGTGLGFRF